jgi:PAS domain S-box-containing protein
VISYDGGVVAQQMIQTAAPQARLTPIPAQRARLEAVCRNHADAAFFDGDSASATLLDGIDCGGQRLRVVQTPELNTLLGVGSTLACSPVADSLREGIATLADQGGLSPIFARRNYFSLRRFETTAAVIHARRRQAQLITGMCTAAALVVIAFWLAFRLRRERDAARRSEERFRLLFEQTPAGIFQFDSGLVLRECNDRFCSILQAPKDCLIGFDLNNVRDRRILGSLRQVLAGEPGRYVGAYQATNGTANVSIEMVTVPLFKGRRTEGGIGIVEDISARLRAETALRESERRHRDMLETVQMVAVSEDLTGRVTYCNDFTLSITGWSRDEVVGRHAGEFLPEEYREAWAANLARATATGQAPSMFERPILTRDGKWRWIQWNLGILRDQDGRLTGIGGLGVDVTEHRNLREQYRQAQKLETVGRLAGGVAHDFNNLLTVINGYSSLALAGLSESDPVRSHVTQIRAAGDRAAQLTHQLLAFSRKQIIQPKPLDLCAILAEAADMLRRLIGEDIRLVIRPTSSGRVLADPGQLVQVLMNLAVNARDAMADGGSLTIETSDADLEDGQLPGSGEMKPGPYVLLVVTDTGTGMTRETRRHLFEPFFTTKDVGKGTGLGLSTVYGIVRQGNGWITVESAPGEGTTFRIWLPRFQGRESAPDPGAAPAATIPGRGTVLVVEDQESVRQFARQVLAAAGYCVLEAAGGEDALKTAADHPQPIHLLVTDVILPGMNGHQLAARFRELYPETRVLFTSGYADAAAGRDGALPPGVEFLPKPYGPAALAEKVAALLGRPRYGVAKAGH